jgi:carboxylesterase
MPQPSGVDPTSFFFAGGPAGCLLIHGFTGSPAEVRPMGEHLTRCGFTVSAPLLAGHGTTPKDLAQARWQDWFASVEEGYRTLREACDEVFVAGFSLGSLLAVHLAVHHQVSGVILLSPGFWLRDRRAALVPLFRRLVEWVPKDLDADKADLADHSALELVWSYDVLSTSALHQSLLLQRIARDELRCVLQPTLVIHAVRDRSIAAHSGPRTYEGLPSEDKEMLELHESGHLVVLDSERDVVFQRVSEWMQTRTGRSAPEPA